ncbi:MAG: class I SAM-dependent methyltransferase [Chloroflexi bacterium]|nr:class I SAM-dependent methyltransferase [Chloroflexota bacterium]
MIRTARRPCPICNDTQVDILHAQRFALPEGHPLSDGYEIVCCETCGFVYADTAVSQEAYDLFYAQYSKYEDQKNSTGSGENPWDRKRLEEAAHRIATFLSNTDKKILDVGCANGGMLKALKDLGYKKLTGIDPSPICVANTRQLGIEAEPGSLFAPFKQGIYDCVILSHTLEHVQDIRQAAQWIDNVLRKDIPSWVYVEVPDAARYMNYVYAPFQDFNTEHINHFSMTSLQNFLRTNGFEPVEWGDKLLESSPNMDYPAIYCFAKRSAPLTNAEIKNDTLLRERIDRYIEISHGVLDQIEARLRPALANTPQVIVWGTGQLAMKLLVETSLSQAKIAAFVDSNPINQGKTLRGVPVIAPEAIASSSDPILISSTLHQQSIVNQINKMGLKNPLILLRD